MDLERQALVRARAVAGDPALGQRFARLRRDVCSATGTAMRCATTCGPMRERMRTELGSRRSGRFDLKQDPGGSRTSSSWCSTVRCAGPRGLGADLDFTDNVRLLEGFGKAGLMPAEDVALLADAYRAYRGRITSSRCRIRGDGGRRRVHRVPRSGDRALGPPDGALMNARSRGEDGIETAHRRRARPRRAQCGEPVHGHPGRPAAELSHARHVPVELASEGLSPHRGQGRGEVPVLRAEYVLEDG